MVEMAIGVTVFLLATLGAVQLGLEALAQEGVQTATLAGARTASGAPATADPTLTLESGALAARSALSPELAGMATLSVCPEGGSSCWASLECVRYEAGAPQPGTQEPCDKISAQSLGPYAYGPIPSDLDGAQNPACHGGGCFGVASTMAPCATAAVAGHLMICVAYTSWPPVAVDVWVAGGLRAIVPWVGSAGPGTIPVASRLRLAVEAFS
jgi:hypothetical protein